ncbi:MAG TPA: glycoside hydrolase family 16 protein [Mycobacteriales bacterium]|nr:glycoside hydrolase family 16 protein [Mycobacteriales bacterium]
MRAVLTVFVLVSVGLLVGDLGLVAGPPDWAAAAELASPPLCGGELVLKPDGTPWVCSFDDEFDATTGDPTQLDRSKWVVQTTAASNFWTGPYPNFACYVDDPNNVSVSDGYLNLTARQESAPFDCHGLGGTTLPTSYTAGEVTTNGTFSQTYGRFEVRAKLPSATVKGLQETLWLWPVDDTKYGAWPDSGEIDFAEFYSQYPTLDVPYIHYQYDASTTDPATDTNVVTNTTDCTINPGSFNDYVAVWEPGTITLSVNGHTCVTDHYVATGLTPPAPFDQPFFLTLTQALGVNTNAFDPATTPLPATTQVDYVRVWK